MAAAVAGERRDDLSWPQSASHTPTLRIGEVRQLLSAEFPLISASKVRHYESLGLVCPQRSATNQRLFSDADVERLRFIMREQRDRFLPLDQIGEMLRQLDAGEVAEDARPERIRVVSDDDDEVRPRPHARLRLSELADESGAPLETIESMVKAGILHVDARGRFSSHAPEIIRYALMLQESGYDLRQIRQVRTSAHSHAVMMSNQRALEFRSQAPGAGERAIAHATEDTVKLSRLYQALLSEQVEVELR